MSYLDPVLTFLGVVTASGIAAVGGQWYERRRINQRAHSPAGRAEAVAIETTAILKREEWLDQSTRSLFEELRTALADAREEVDEAREEVKGARAEVRGLRRQVGQLSAEVDRISLKLAACEQERDEALALVDEIRRAGETG